MLNVEISDDAPPRSIPNSVGSSGAEKLEREQSSLNVDDSNKEPSEISENENKGRLDQFTEFCRKNESRLLEVLAINKNLITDMEGADAMYVVGSSEPREMKKIIMCGYMRYDATEIINLNQNPKDFESFINSQRYPIAISRILSETEELCGAFLHSIANLTTDIKLGLIRRGNRLLMFKLTNTGLETLRKCAQKAPHSHGWHQTSSENITFFDESQLAKCVGEQKEMHTKIIRRNNEINSVIRVVPGVQVSEKIEPKNDNFKFTEKFYFSAQKYNKWPFLVLIPNEANVLASIHKMDKLEDVIEQYRDQRVVICCKSPKSIPGNFSRALLQMKNAIACAISIRIKGNFFLLYKLAPQATEDKITDVVWDDVEGGKQSAIYEKIYTYCATTAK